MVSNPDLIGANIGKGYVPPFNFFLGYEKGGGGGNDPGQSAGHAPGMGADLLKAMAITAGIAVVVVAILVYAGYGVYHCYFEER
ncbi:MAG: hypothetical protein RRA94_01890 [Bacteroidota bacterium]|nr:hypothetical protein [Bacteroidota bacterium]